ncbi:hypothetical protein BKA82DRAFT_4337924 [Pisolithus tinctorius]|nr:hypothetical protein BKA82DRAFT_4337924 [Pisolithus tinctorius]
MYTVPKCGSEFRPVPRWILTLQLGVNQPNRTTYVVMRGDPIPTLLSTQQSQVSTNNHADTLIGSGDPCQMSVQPQGEARGKKNARTFAGISLVVTRSAVVLKSQASTRGCSTLNDGMQLNSDDRHQHVRINKTCQVPRYEVEGHPRLVYSCSVARALTTSSNIASNILLGVVALYRAGFTPTDDAGTANYAQVYQVSHPWTSLTPFSSRPLPGDWYHFTNLELKPADDELGRRTNNRGNAGPAAGRLLFVLSDTRHVSLAWRSANHLSITEFPPHALTLAKPSWKLNPTGKSPRETPRGEEKRGPCCREFLWQTEKVKSSFQVQYPLSNFPLLGRKYSEPPAYVQLRVFPSYTKQDVVQDAINSPPSKSRWLLVQVRRRTKLPRSFNSPEVLLAARRLQVNISSWQRLQRIFNGFCGSTFLRVPSSLDCGFIPSSTNPSWLMLCRQLAIMTNPFLDKVQLHAAVQGRAQFAAQEQFRRCSYLRRLQLGPNIILQSAAPALAYYIRDRGATVTVEVHSSSAAYSQMQNKGASPEQESIKMPSIITTRAEK